MAPGTSRRRAEDSREDARRNRSRSRGRRRSNSAGRGRRHRDREQSRERERERRDKRRRSPSRSRNRIPQNTQRLEETEQPSSAARGLFDELLADGVAAAAAAAEAPAPPPPPPPDEAPPLPADPVRQEELDAAVAAAVASISARVAEKREGAEGAAGDAAGRRKRRSGWDEGGPEQPMNGPAAALQAALALPLGLASPPPMTLQEAMSTSSTRPSAINMQVQQSCIGYLIGKGGESLKAIQNQSNANIQVDQSLKESLGVSIMRISGSEKACAVARALIDQRVQEVRTPVSADQVGVAGVVAEFKVEQTYVGFFIGKGGEQVKKIKNQTGANVIVDQSTKDEGYSIVRIMNSPGWEQAKAQVEHRLDQAREATLQNMAAGQAEEMPVPQAMVGWLIGKGGEGLRSVKQASGATVVLNQDTKDRGYSVMRFAGDKEAIAQAKAIIQQRINEADGKGGLPPLPGQAPHDPIQVAPPPAWNGSTLPQTASPSFPGLPPPSAFAEIAMQSFSSPFSGSPGLPGVVAPPHFGPPVAGGGGPAVVLPPSMSGGFHPRTVLPPPSSAMGGKGYSAPTFGGQTIVRPQRPPMQVLPPPQLPGTGHVVFPPSM